MHPHPSVHCPSRHLPLAGTFGGNHMRSVSFHHPPKRPVEFKTDEIRRNAHMSFLTYHIVALYADWPRPHCTRVHTKLLQK